MIEVQGLTKYYGSVAAVRDVSFSVEKGQILGFLGPNGAGKTTTMRILTGYFPATSGSAKVAGYSVTSDLDEVRRRIGYLPENVPLYRDMSVESYVDLAAQVKGVVGRERRDAVNRVIGSVGLDSMRRRLIKKLSRGYRQRVGLAQALVNNPEVLILDEPTVGLDPRQITEIRSLIKDLSGDRTVILSTHILPEVSITCDHVTVINNGSVVRSDTLANLTNVTDRHSQLSIQFRGDRGKIVAALGALQGVTVSDAIEQVGESVASCNIDIDSDGKAGDVADRRGDISRAVVDSGGELLQFKSRETTLEEVFLRILSNDGAAQTAAAEA